jgi:hypothetical protein
MEDGSPQRPRDASKRDREQMAYEDVNTAIQTIETFVRQENWPVRIRDAWRRVKEAAIKGGEGAGNQGVAQSLKELQDQMKGLTTTVRELAIAPTTKKALYADVLRNSGTANPQTEREMPVPARRSREVVVAPGDEDTTQKQRTGPELVRDINTKIQCESVVAARRLPSGDTLVTFEGEEAKKKWEKDQAVLDAFGTNARIRTREYTVIAHGIRVAAIDPKNQKTAIESIYAQNPRLQGVVEIVRVGWANKTIRLGKRTAPLHLGIAAPDQANQLIEQGLLHGSELHDCEVFYGECQVTQCFKCYSYGHTAKHCRSVIRCGFCAAAGHSSNDCPKKEDLQAYKCAVCKGNPRYTAWARECPIRRIQVAKARQAYLERPTRFQARTTPKNPIFSPFEVEMDFAPSQTPLTFSGTLGESDAEIEAPRPKRRRGKPSTYEVLQRPETGSQDIRGILQRPQNE